MLALLSGRGAKGRLVCSGNSDSHREQEAAMPIHPTKSGRTSTVRLCNQLPDLRRNATGLSTRRRRGTSETSRRGFAIDSNTLTEHYRNFVGIDKGDTAG